VAAEDNRAVLYGFSCCATISAAVFHPPSLALSLARATPVCENTDNHTTLETSCQHRAQPCPQRTIKAQGCCAERGQPVG